MIAMTNDYQVYPGAEEICDQKDSDCDGFMPDNEDFDGDGYTLCDGDCEDEDPTIWPDNPEICDGIDNNCWAVLTTSMKTVMAILLA